MGSHLSEHILVVEAMPETCFDVLVDYDRLREWQKAVVECDVLEHDKKSGSKLVEMKLDLQIRQVRYIMRFHYDRPHRIWWDYIEGDVNSIDGEYQFYQGEEEGTTEVHYRLEIDPGRFVPGPIKKILTDQALKTSLQELKDRAEEFD